MVQFSIQFHGEYLSLGLNALLRLELKINSCALAKLVNQILLQIDFKLNDTMDFMVQFLIQFHGEFLSLRLNALLKLELKINSFLIIRYFLVLYVYL